MNEPITIPDEFAATMQQLSAEAEQKLQVMDGRESLSDRGALSNVAQEIQGLNSRLESLERVLVRKIDDLAAGASSEGPIDLALEFQKVEKQLSAICSTERVNQKLFDTMHAELLNYRDNFVHESLQKPFIHDLVLLFDDLNGLAEQMRTAVDEQKTSGSIGQWRDNLQNSIHSLVEILHRFGVKEVEPKEFIDRSLHRVVSYEPADFAEEEGRIVMRVRRGFLWRGKVIRPEEVIAKRFG
jgi:molecular chaperone GrpE (heat shock protein)